MLVDVLFPIYAPTEEWSKAFKEMNYDTERIHKEYGSPFISSQDKDVKVCDGVYYTDLNPESWFKITKLDTCNSYVSPINPDDLKKLREENKKNNKYELDGLYELKSQANLLAYGSEEHITYGVCDNYQQILDKWPHLESSTQRHFITMTPIYKKSQPEREGWRWHKWGEYIGDHEIQHEYLYDEEGIELVYVFHIFTLKLESGLGEVKPF